MKVLAFWGVTIFSILLFGIILDNINILATHSLVQGATDAAVNAGANQRQLRISSDDVHEFIIEPTRATNAARATFNKNLSNIEQMGRETSRIQEPTYSFPDEYSIDAEVNMTHEMQYSTSVFNNFFSAPIVLAPITDSVEAESDLNYRK